MAIMTGLPGLEVDITVQRRHLPEYKHEEDDEIAEEEFEAMSRFVEATTGARFAVTIKFEQANFPFALADLQVSISIDGKHILRRISESEQRLGNRPLTLDYVDRHTEHGFTRQYFTFAELHVHEGDADKSLYGKLDQLGTISVTFQRIKFRVREPHPANNFNRKRKFSQDDVQPLTSAIEDDYISEKNLKGSAISHQARLSDPMWFPRRHDRPEKHINRQIVPLDRGRPFATYTFRYRSRAALQALLLIPRSPSPIPLEDRAPEELTVEETKVLMARQREREAHEAFIRSVKVEEARLDQYAGEDNEDVEVVDDRPVKRVRLLEGPGGKVIDVDDW